MHLYKIETVRPYSLEEAKVALRILRKEDCFVVLEDPRSRIAMQVQEPATTFYLSCQIGLNILEETMLKMVPQIDKWAYLLTYEPQARITITEEYLKKFPFKTIVGVLGPFMFLMVVLRKVFR